MAADRMRRELPAWVLPLVIVIGVIVLVVIGVKAFTGSNGEVGPPKAVHPGMIDFRKEFQQGNVGRRHRQ